MRAWKDGMRRMRADFVQPDYTSLRKQQYCHEIKIFFIKYSLYKICLLLQQTGIRRYIGETAANRQTGAGECGIRCTAAAGLMCRMQQSGIMPNNGIRKKIFFFRICENGGGSGRRRKCRFHRGFSVPFIRECTKIHKQVTIYQEKNAIYPLLFFRLYGIIYDIRSV